MDLTGRELGGFIVGERLDDGAVEDEAVYRCFQLMAGRDAIIKVRRGAGHQAIMREARLLREFDHPYAAHIYDVGIERDLVWLAMELVQGTTLEQRIVRHGPMPLEVFVPLFERIAQVVQDAHERGIIHRNLKPANIMVTELAGGALSPKLGGFGGARVLGEASSAAAPIGTPAYMAPEQWLGNDVGPAADIYALGVIAYEAITGRRPYDSATRRGYAEQHIGAPIPALGGEFGGDLDSVMSSALSKQAVNRPLSALDLAASIRAASGVTIRRVSAAGGTLKRQVQDAARAWQSGGRAAGLLWRGSALAAIERAVAAKELGQLETLFLASCRRAAVRGMWNRRLAVALAAVLALGVVLGVLQYRAATRARIAEAAITSAEIEQGRQALLHGDLAEAQRHLGEAYRRGARDPGTLFMLARALEPNAAEQARMQASAGRMWSAGWSPDGSQIVTTDDTAAQIWEGGRMVRTLPHGDTVYDARWLSGGKLVTACGDGAVRIWDTTTGRVERALRGPAARYTALAVAPDGATVAAMDTDGEAVRAWSTGDGALLAEFAGDGAGKPAIAYSHDGRWLAVSGGDTVQIYETGRWGAAAAGSPPVVRLAAKRVRGMAWDPTSAQIVTGGADGDVSVWAIPDGLRVRHLIEVSDPVDAVAWSSDGARIAAARAGAVLVWGRGPTAARITTDIGHAWAVEFGTASRLLAIAQDNGVVEVVDSIDAMVVSRLAGDGGMIRTARFAPDDASVIGASWDGTARIWSTKSMHERWRDPRPADPVGASLVFASGEVVQPAGADVDAIALLDDGRTAVADAQGRLRIYDRQGVQHAELALTVRAQAMRSSGARLLVLPSFAATAGARPELVDLGTGRIIARLDVRSGRVLGARFIDHGARLLTASNDGVVTIWDAATGARVNEFRARTQFFDADASDTVIAAGGASGSVWFWDRSNGLPLWTMPAHKAAVIGIQLGRDGLVTRAFDGEQASWVLSAVGASVR